MKKALIILYLVAIVFGDAGIESDKSVRKSFPNLRIKNLKNRQITTEAILDSQLTLVNFWATFCVPCRKEMKHLNHLHNAYMDSSFQVVGISIDDSRTARRVSSVVKSQKLDYPIYLDTEQKLYKQFNSSAMPFSVLVSPNGYILWEHTGYIPGDEEEMEEIILKELGIAIKTDSLQIDTIQNEK
ncbi:MAG: TlpA family protein disulfide reductase [Candidatus Marinimicrobia bacterium]|nr:TlpA family protein disulfide reductase [Candidatus Neomarinimicrobiota bacterium]MBL7023369.1 TlpA family protein disulfide reductase [Candidatus Neomarinimicrobiota bacterium]MBL7109328.1 TlpA family protein disulfide reductase [Candidatus Neomarinimicrobiota bacterium]